MTDVLVADDEGPVLDELALLLRADERIGRIRLARTGAEALRLLSEEPAKIVFLDIHMPGLSGLDLARTLQQFHLRPAVVFVTAADDRAVEAFDVAAVDYLLKPVRPERLRVAVGRAIRASTPGEIAQPDERIPVTIAGETRFVRRSEVRWVHAQGDYSRLWTANGDFLVRTPISKLDDQWSSSGFIRVHRSFLVRSDAIVNVRLGGPTPFVGLPEIEIPVSRRLVADVRERLSRR